MREKFTELIFCVAIAIVFSLNFYSKWINYHFEKVKDKQTTWYWLRVFKIKETKENYVKMIRGMSLFVIAIMTLAIISIMILA